MNEIKATAIMLTLVLAGALVGYSYALLEISNDCSEDGYTNRMGGVFCGNTYNKFWRKKND